MKLSIVTCTYNSEAYLQQTIDSVIAQQLDSTIYEHIFIDGNSNDKTLEIIKNYQISQWDLYTIIVIQKQPKGIYNAMNEWIKIAQGEYITFLNSDDYYSQKVLKDYVEFIEKDWNKDLYYGINNFINIDWKFLHEYPHRSIYKKWLNPYLLGMACYVSHPSTLYKKELHNKYWLYNENLRLVSDAEFFITLAKAKISNTFYNTVIANFRIHEWSASNNTDLQERENEKVRINIFGKFLGTIMNQVFKIMKRILS